MRHCNSWGHPRRRGQGALVVLVFFLASPCLLAAAEGPAPVAANTTATVRLATYNVRNYNAIDRHEDGQFRPDWPKPEAEKTALREVIRSAHPDVLAVQEIGGAPYLEELQRDLATEGLAYPYATLVNGPDPDRHVAVLSRLPLGPTHAFAQVPIKVGGVADTVKRGLLEVQFTTNGQVWTLYVVHLKSRLTETAADPKSAAEREAEARVLRDLIRQRQPVTADGRVAVVGDFNDARDSPPLKRFLELDGKPLFLAAPAADARGETWTENYAPADEYTRSDFILLSPTLAAQQAKSGVVDIPAAGTASDHRLVWVDLTMPAGNSTAGTGSAAPAAVPAP